MNMTFLQWWRANAPKGTSNSVNALIIVGLIHKADRPLTLIDFEEGSKLPRQSCRTIVDFLVEEGFLVRGFHNKANRLRSREGLYSLAPMLRAQLDKAAPHHARHAPTVLIEHLTQHREPLTVRQIAEATGLPEPRVSRHLNALCDARRVEAVGRTPEQHTQTLYRLAA